MLISLHKILPSIMKYNFTILILSICFVACKKQNQPLLTDVKTASTFQNPFVSDGPKAITRNVIKDKKGNLWMAAFDGVYKYDGTSFTNVISKVTQDRFFSILEDRKGTLWFGSINSGVYSYDGTSIQNFTTADGLIHNFMSWIYEDKKGNIWFGSGGGASRYDGTRFQNFILIGDGMYEDKAGLPSYDTPSSDEVTSIIEDKSGKYWFATRGYTFIYNGKTFITVSHENQPFRNVRTICEDKNGNIWLGGNDGLWRYDGQSFLRISDKFTGYIYADSHGNLWTSSQGKSPSDNWTINRYDAKTLDAAEPAVKEIQQEKAMTFGITEAKDGSIWFGALGGVYRYDGETVSGF